MRKTLRDCEEERPVFVHAIEPTFGKRTFIESKIRSMANKEDTQRRIGVVDRFVLIVIFRIPLTEFEINESSKVKLPFLFPPPNPLGHSDTGEPSRHSRKEACLGAIVRYSGSVFSLFILSFSTGSRFRFTVVLYVFFALFVFVLS